MIPLFLTFSAAVGMFHPEAQDLHNSDVRQELLPSRIAASHWASELSVGLQTAREAGNEILRIKHSGTDLQIQNKEGIYQIVSPVTIADTRANEIICRTLITQFPTYGLLTEEAVDDEVLLKAIERWQVSDLTWIIDPLDGTKAFIRNGTDYGVHIGLTLHGEPVLGINYYPETDTAYFAVKGCGAYKQVGNLPAERVSVSHVLEEEIRPIGNSDPKETAHIYQELFGMKISNGSLPNLDSCGWKICMISEGNSYNLYISSGIRGGIWDYCSGEVILCEAGGVISDLKGNPIDYRSDEGRNKEGLVICNDKALHEKVIEVNRTTKVQSRN